jgi:hypothetical protein
LPELAISSPKSTFTSRSEKRSSEGLFEKFFSEVLLFNVISDILCTRVVADSSVTAASKVGGAAPFSIFHP